MKTLVKSTLLTLCILSISIVGWTQDFNGIITIKETHRANVVKKMIYVKGDMVRLETYLPNDEKSLKGVKIVDLSTGKVTALIPARKLYLEMPKKTHSREVEVAIVKSNEKKAFLGKDCSKVVVTSEKKRAKVIFWLYKGNFTFYAKLMSTLKKNENVTRFFSKLDAKGSGTIPMVMIEKRLDDTLISKTEVSAISEETVSDDLFKVPEDYSLEER